MLKLLNKEYVLSLNPYLQAEVSVHIKDKARSLMHSLHATKNILKSEQASEGKNYRIMEYPFHYLILMQRSYSEMVSKTLLPYHISNHEWRILASLREKEMLTVSEFANIAQIDKTRTSRLVEMMLQRGLINRVQDKSDRRCVKVTLTAAGESTYIEIHPLVIELKDKYFQGISAEHYRIFLDVLKQAKINSTQLSSDK